MVDTNENSTTNIEEKMKQDSLDRDRIMEEVNRNLDNHSRRIVEYGQKAKTLDLLEVKYNSLERESKEVITTMQKKIDELTETNANLENEVMILRKTILNFKSKTTGLRSAMELIINDFGIDQVVLATGIDKDKLKEYLRN